MGRIVLLIVGSIIILIWAVSHIVPVKGVVNGFGDISEDNRRIITMEWISEGLTLCFIGALVLTTVIAGETDGRVSLLLIRACAVMLILMAGLTALTGARTAIMPIKLCPIVKGVVAGLYIAASFL